MTTQNMTARRPPLLLLGIFGLFVMVLVSLSPSISQDGDIGWHLATGRYIAAHGAVPTTDPFSLTFAGRPWVAHEWLSDLMLAGAEALGGWSGLAVLVGATVAALLVIMGSEIGRHLPPRPTLIMLLLGLGVLQPAIFARPHVLAWIPLALWTIMLMRAVERRRAPPLAGALLMLVWVNMHGSFIVGLGLVGVFGLEALLQAEDRGRAFRDWLVFGLLTMGATLLNPAGVDGLLFPFMVNQLQISSVIVEWLPTVLAERPGLSVFLIVGLATLLYRGVKVPPLRLLLLLGVAFMAFASARHQSLLVIIGSLVIAAPLGATFPATADPAPAPRWALGLVVALALAYAGVRMANPAPRPDSAANPATLIAALPPALTSQPVLNGYGLGGSLIRAGIRPYIDGRADMYGDAFAARHHAIVNGDRAAFDAAVRRWHITWTILPPGDPLVAVLDGSADWQRLAADRYAIVHVRRPPTSGQLTTPDAGRPLDD